MNNIFVIIISDIWSYKPAVIRYFFNSNTNLTKINDYKTKYKYLCLAIYES